MERDRVYELINGERDHQDSLWKDKADRDAGGVGNYIAVMQTYLNRARDAYSDSEDNTVAMDYIGCITALGV